MNYKAFPIDWRFLPEPALVCKDSIRHVLNKAGGGPHLPSIVGKAWFKLYHRTQLSRVKAAGVVFVHVPRTGGTSVGKVLYGQNLPHVSLAYLRRVGGEPLARLPSFSIIRSPTARIVSAYRFIRAGGTSLMACSRYDPLGLRRISTFDAFIEAIARHQHQLRSYDVLRAQSEYVTDSSGILLVDRLFAFEDVAQGSPDLHRWLGANDLPMLNASDHLPLSISANSRRLIETIYANDLQLHDRVRRT
ncbi:hypothetical protein B0I00_2885 [Novosphingobium kunmingense]|uniref:Sulfotransferase family protein n=1 Tax=Novosphingobium kunmingense TaxID=1211806 RepID=A0A2N0H5N5_9SPHN|nr:hypothetical protein [Novosphingobium kunmingense]PKB14253.1 hypothetical protein B0I00_2885 [Novosphingobium kunmingense]